MSQSILKNGLSSKPARSREDRNKETALYHAQILQQRKDVEALILASTETLLELPSSSTADPARPCLQDITLVKNSLRLFQPSDYDLLIEERNINRQCGYLLCPKPNRQENTNAKYRILPGKKKDHIKFVARHTLERWCSDDCGKRALYVKVQLDEEPAWSRVGPSGGDILLLEDKRNDQKRHGDQSTLIEELRALDMSLEEDEVITRMKTLAIERGDEKAPNRSIGLGEIDVRERRDLNSKTFAPGPPTTVSSPGGGSGSIEGYTPKFPRKGSKELEPGDDADEDLMPTI